MYTHCSSMNLRLPVSSCLDGNVSCDRSLTYEFPLSPSNQLMYESEPLQDQCCVHGHIQPHQSVLETGVISPTVEGLTFNDCDVLSLVFANDQLPAAVVSSSDAVLTTNKYLSDDKGPTLTQLNSEDLDATLLDDFGVSSSAFCVDMSSLDCSQLIDVKPMTTNITSMPSTTAALSSWSEQIRHQRDETLQQQQQQLMSHIMSSQRQIDNVPQCTVTNATYTHIPATSASSAASTIQLNLDRNWEAIESFLKSEDERMAAEATNHQQLQLTAYIKSEAPGIGV